MNKQPARKVSDALRKAAEEKLAATQTSDLSARSAEDLLHELQVHQIELEMQNETLRATQLDLKASRDQYADLYDFAPVGYLTINREGVISQANLTCASLLNVERKKLLTHRFDQFIAREDQDHWYLFIHGAYKKQGLQTIELRINRKNDTCFYAQLECIQVIEQDEKPVIRVTLTDSTERKRIEAGLERQQKLEEQETVRKKLEYAYGEWINALDAVNDPIFLHDKEFRILRCNKAYQHWADIPFKQIIGQPYYEIFPITHAPMSCCLQSHKNEEEILIGDTIFRSRSFGVNDDQGAYLYSVHILENVTERTKLEKTLRDSEARLRLSMNAVRDAFIVMEIEHDTITSCNPATGLMFGYRVEELIGQVLHKTLVPVRYREAASKGLAHFAVTGEGVVINKLMELVALHKDGTEFPIELSVSTLQLGGKWHAIGILRDISKRKQLELTLDHSNRILSARSHINAALVHATDEKALMQQVCQTIINQRGFRMAWVGYALQDENKSIQIMASAGFVEGYLDAVQLMWPETELGMGPSGRAVRSGTTQLCQDIAQDPTYLPWRDRALANGYAASISLPLFDSNHNVFGTLAVYADEKNAFIPAEITLLEEMAQDLSFGVNALRTRQERDSAAEKIRQQILQLQSNLEDTIRAIASIVERRDSYTAGHQRRVADLACTIARQMGLPDEQVHGIEIAGIVHDLGKIQIPSDILSKPGKISVNEFALIKEHPQVGFEILKDIDFPWPVAQTVLQHHERLDGSGYPQGLKGNDIILEARILIVADVIEAMSSHRPYRPGLGMDVALAEIVRLRGIHFDSNVVDACLTVFREHKYRFPNEMHRPQRTNSRHNAIPSKAR